MGLQKFDPKLFSKEVERLSGNSDPGRFQIVYDFAVDIGDQSKLNQCLKHSKRLAGGLTPVVFRIIIILIITAYDDYRVEKKYIKPLQAKIKKGHANEKKSLLKHISKSIQTLKALDPDPSKFDEKYLSNLAKKTVAEIKVFSPQNKRNNATGMRVASNLIEEDLARQREEEFAHRVEGAALAGVSVLSGRPLPKKRNPKGLEGVRLLIHDVHALLKRSGSTLSDSTICSHLASLLSILTGTKYSRQNVQNILSRKPEISGIPTPAK